MKKTYFKLVSDSVAIIPDTNEHGKLQARIYQNGKDYSIDISPLKLIEWNLSQIGFSLRGCRDTARQLLKTTSMFPVCLNYELLIFFSTESMKNDTCVWVALHKVYDINPITSTESQICCYDGVDLVVPVSYSSLVKRWRSAIVLKFMLEQSKKQQLVYGENRQEVLVVSDGYRVTYKVRFKK